MSASKSFFVLRSIMNKLPKTQNNFKISTNVRNLSFKAQSFSKSNSLFQIRVNKNVCFISYRKQMWTCACLKSASSHVTRADPSQTLTKSQAQELALRLTTEERSFLLTALQEYESKLVKDEYEGQLAASRWRSKFGRPSKLPTLGDVDPTGTFCPMPEDWLNRKYAETVPPPTPKDLMELTIANAIPFIGFGFLDNFIMISAGDYIDLYLGSYLCISTMAAAALGNTFSDVLGIGSAYYVERIANSIGVKAPNLTPIQLDMKPSRHAANFGRVIGVTIGCLLGMFPLMFLKKKEDLIEQQILPNVDISTSSPNLDQ